MIKILSHFIKKLLQCYKRRLEKRSVEQKDKENYVT